MHQLGPLFEALFIFSTKSIHHLSRSSIHGVFVVSISCSSYRIVLNQSRTPDATRGADDYHIQSLDDIELEDRRSFLSLLNRVGLFDQLAYQSRQKKERLVALLEQWMRNGGIDPEDLDFEEEPRAPRSTPPTAISSRGATPPPRTAPAPPERGGPRAGSSPGWPGFRTSRSGSG